jgi:spore coat protein CotH
MIFTNVGLHLKGSAGSFRQIDDPKPAFTLSFNQFNLGPRFHGLRKIHLNNSVQDGSYLNEILAGELFRGAGVPATRAAHALVEFNGKKLGLYVLKEGFTKDFLARYFKKTNGNLYDMDPGREITEKLKKDMGDGPNDWSDLKALTDAARESDVAARWARLDKVLDLDRFVSFMVMEIMTCHWDGYCIGRNNFRIYGDRDSNKMVLFPHGTDQMFQNAISPIRPGMQGLLALNVMRTPQGRHQYRERFGTLFTNLFQTSLLTSRVDAVVQQIEQHGADGAIVQRERRQVQVKLARAPPAHPPAWSDSPCPAPP